MQDHDLITTTTTTKILIMLLGNLQSSMGQGWEPQIVVLG